MAMLLSTGKSISVLANTQFQDNGNNTHDATVAELRNGPGHELTTFIEKDAVRTLLGQKGGAGIWIYPAVEVDLNDDLCMVAVASGADRIELRNENENICFCCYTDASKSTREISITEGGNMVNDRRPNNTIKNRAAFKDLVNDDRLKALFHRQQVQELLDESGDMIRMEVVDMEFDDQSSPIRTIALASADRTGSAPGKLAASLMPCPPDCPDDGGYL